MTAASGNSARARARVLSTFVPWWQPWRRCRVRSRFTGKRCALDRRHYGRHAWCDSFDVHYFDALKDGTP